MLNSQTYHHFKLDFQKVDQHTGGKWLIHGTKRRMDNQLQSLELPCRNPSRECKHDIKESKGNDDVHLTEAYLHHQAKIDDLLSDIHCSNIVYSIFKYVFQHWW